MNIGPTAWWQSNLVKNSPVGCTLPDGSRIICKNGGTAWIVAPSCTQVSSQWAGGQYNSTAVGTKCCISEWSGLQSQLIACGFNPSDWFVPNVNQLLNPGYACRTQWDSYTSSTFYWSSSEFTAPADGYVVLFSGGSGNNTKSISYCVRAMRCVTY